MSNVMVQTEGFTGRCQKVLQVARQLYQGKPDWVTFFRETLGVNGAARSVFPTQDEYVQFEQSGEFSEIQKLVSSLRTRRTGSKHEATRVITVRLPESLHEALKAEASDHNTSMNKLCISKLLQVLIDNEKQAQAAAASSVPSRATTLPISSAVTGSSTSLSGSAQTGMTNGSDSSMSPTAAAAASGASPNFRSTYGQTSTPNMTQSRRFGQ